MNTRRITPTVCAFLLLLALVACNRVSGKNSTAKSIGAGDAGNTITLNQGESLVVTLDGNPTTGYNWLMQTMDPAILKQVGEPAYTPESNQLGASGKITITFQAVRTGQAKLVLSYVRSFEKDTAPVNTFEVMVVVK
jgi:inhibitor of cysteine peptidase